MKKLTHVILVTMLFLVSNIALSSSITLTEKKEIQVAAELSHAIDVISAKVMECLKDNHGNTDRCFCTSYETCQFKPEYKNLISKYCTAITRYPAWKGKAVNFSIKNDPMGHVLGMVGLAKQMGDVCK